MRKVAENGLLNLVFGLRLVKSVWYFKSGLVISSMKFYDIYSIYLLGLRYFAGTLGFGLDA